MNLIYFLMGLLAFGIGIVYYETGTKELGLGFVSIMYLCLILIELQTIKRKLK